MTLLGFLAVLAIRETALRGKDDPEDGPAEVLEAREPLEPAATSATDLEKAATRGRQAAICPAESWVPAGHRGPHAERARAPVSAHPRTPRTRPGRSRRCRARCRTCR
ncbi:hypothetical protein ACU686_23300 [Yinghuangia aomiensis]